MKKIGVSQKQIINPLPLVKISQLLIEQGNSAEIALDGKESWYP